MKSLAVVLALSAPAAADPFSGAAAGPSVSANAEAPRHAPHGLALGVELGEPSSATVAWYAEKLVLSGAFGTGTREGLGPQGHADVQLEIRRLAPAIPLRVGLGARLYHHGYQLASVDELPDTHVGIRASAQLALERGRLQFYAELAPGIDVMRTSSCNLSSGARSVCPHAQENPVFVQLAIGARWFLSP